MYKQNAKQRTTLKVCKQQEGETIERKMQRMMKNGAEADDVTEMIFTERKDGVIPETDIRHDRWETAVDATTDQSKNHLAKRDERHNPTPGGEQSTDENKG